MQPSAVTVAANYAGRVTDSSGADTTDRRRTGRQTGTQRPTLKGDVAAGKNGAGGRKTDGPPRTRSRVGEREKRGDKGRDVDKEAMTGRKREGQAMGGGYYGYGEQVEGGAF